MAHKGDDEIRGEFLKRARERAGFTQETAAQQSGVKQDVIAKAEQGRDLRTSNFLNLLYLYDAVDELAELLRKSRRRESGKDGASGSGKHLRVSREDDIPIPDPSSSTAAPKRRKRPA